MKVSSKHIEGLIKDKVGKDALPLLNILTKRRNISEFKIAEKLDYSVNQVRSILYRMHEYNLVSSTRRKDKKKGWYIYYWTFNIKHAKGLILNLMKQRLQDLRKNLKDKKDKIYFICPGDGSKIYDLEQALEYNFKCPETGELLVEENKNFHIRKIKREIALLEKELGKEAS